jgi:hypothetical protein
LLEASETNKKFYNTRDTWMGDGLVIPLASRPLRIGLGNFIALNEVSGGGGKSPSTRIEFFFRIR